MYLNARQEEGRGGEREREKSKSSWCWPLDTIKTTLQMFVIVIQYPKLKSLQESSGWKKTFCCERGEGEEEEREKKKS